jgi:hypothetical protein
MNICIATISNHNFLVKVFSIHVILDLADFAGTVMTSLESIYGCENSAY